MLCNRSIVNLDNGMFDMSHDINKDGCFREDQYE